MTASFQSMDHSSSIKKIRQQLNTSELGIATVPIELKRNPRVTHPARKTARPQSVPSEVKPPCTSLQIISDFKKKHKDEIGTLKQEITTLKSQLTDAKKDLHSKVSKVSDDVSKVQSETLSAKEQSTKVLSKHRHLHDKHELNVSKVEDISKELSDTKSALKRVEQQLVLSKKESMVNANSIAKKSTDSYDNKIQDQGAQIRELQSAVRELSRQLSVNTKSVQVSQASISSLQSQEANTQSLSSSVRSLHIGEDFNLPEQPDIIKEGGIHKVAPLSLTVNGAVLFHDIGYTTDKKGLIPLFYDPITNRVLLYQGK